MCCLREEELWVGTRKLTLLPTKASFRNDMLHLFSCSETQSDTDMNVIHAEVFIRVIAVLKACYPQMIGLCHEQTVWGFLLIKTVIRRIFFPCHCNITCPVSLLVGYLTPADIMQDIQTLST